MIVFAIRYTTHSKMQSTKMIREVFSFIHFNGILIYCREMIYEGEVD